MPAGVNQDDVVVGPIEGSPKMIEKSCEGQCCVVECKEGNHLVVDIDQP